ncbi:hypothetical protein X777_01172 [Ooceraea biroi]|uniref:Uncharacterized protein n=1 Tax=Ooceraea biroi TaxID=2015173 RepID=A0A026WR70_OOCBI|nr:hypothetical protein X777_01172 [Ooceraea biroi]
MCLYFLGTGQRTLIARCLFAANHTVIPTYGEKRITLDLGLRRKFVWTFIIADVVQPILGCDFLHEYNLLPDVRGRRLLDTLTTLSSRGRLTAINLPHFLPLLQETHIKIFSGNISR